MTPLPGGFNLMPCAPDVCQECAVKHEPGAPHNAQSLYYQYKFYGQHGRWPTWADAMAHCTDEVKQMTIKVLKEHGVDVETAEVKQNG
jgi:hypothetical protein